MIRQMTPQYFVLKKPRQRSHNAVPSIGEFVALNDMTRQLLVAETKVETEDKCNDTDDENDDPEAPPLHPSGTTSRSNTLVELLVSGFGVLLDVFGVLLGLLNHGLLDDDGLCEILEELV